VENYLRQGLEQVQQQSQNDQKNEDKLRLAGLEIQFLWSLTELLINQGQQE